MNVKEDEHEKGRAEKGAGPSEGRAVRASGSGPAQPGRAGLGRVGGAGSGRGSERERGRAGWYPRVGWAGKIFNNAAELTLLDPCGLQK
jgi:hypothetical protein